MFFFLSKIMHKSCGRGVSSNIITVTAIFSSCSSQTLRANRGLFSKKKPNNKFFTAKMHTFTCRYIDTLPYIAYASLKQVDIYYSKHVYFIYMYVKGLSIKIVRK